MNKFLLLILFSFSLTLSIITPGCKGKSTTWITLNDAENIMASSPDSAMTILRSIDIDRDGSEEEKARFALLMSMALDKSYIDTTSFDILQPAIDYYSRKGSPDDKLRTLYYQGRIYQNQGDDGAAMKCFVRATDLRDKINDSLTLAHNYVALGTLYINQYKVNEFIQCNLSAAELYRRIGKRRFEINSYCNALDGYTTLDNKNSADSMMAICIPLVQECADGEYRLFSSTISYTVNFGSPSDIIAFLNRYDGAELGASEAMNFVRGYFSAGENEKALDLLSNIRIDGQVFDSLKYTALKYQILEKEGEYKQALEQLTSYCVMSERYQKKLLSQDLLFIEDKHRIEMDNLIKIQNRDRIISYILLCLSLLLLLTGWLYFRYRFSLSKRLIAEKDADNLRLAQENLVLEKKRFEDERDNLRELLNEQTELSQPIQTAVKKGWICSIACWQRRYQIMMAMPNHILNGLSQYAKTRMSSWTPLASLFQHRTLILSSILKTMGYQLMKSTTYAYTQ